MIKIRVNFRSLAFDYNHDHGYKEQDHFRGWGCDKKRYHVFETPEGDFPEGLVEAFLDCLNNNGYGDDCHYNLFTESEETGEQIAGVCIVHHGGKYEARGFELE